MSDILKKPVHVALLRQTHLEKLAAAKKIDQTPFGLNPNVEPQPLPKEVKEKPYQLPKLPNIAKQVKTQLKLKVLHDRVPPIPEDKRPPCESCKTAACCRVFVVNIDPIEYESGLYGDAAVKITPEMFKQLNSRFLLASMVTAPRASDVDSYYLEGKLGDPCPFLDDNNRCGIYSIRPITCRVYSCVGDSRITEGMRQGTEPIDALSFLPRNEGEK